MCGRYVNAARKEQIKKEFRALVDSSGDKPRYNITPSQMIDAVLNLNGESNLVQLKWGLVPHWAKDAEIGNKLINARAETLTEKPSFRDAFKSRRCIIPATGFYEWQRKGAGGKQPFYFYLKDKDIFGFAGLYETWLDKQTGEELETATIITTQANAVLKPVHDRMPVILEQNYYDEWLDPKVKDTDKLQDFLKPYSADEMSSHAVSKSVNVPDVDSSKLITPINSL